MVRVASKPKIDYVRSDSVDERLEVVDHVSLVPTPDQHGAPSDVSLALASVISKNIEMRCGT